MNVELKEAINTAPSNYENELVLHRAAKPKLFYSYIRKNKIGKPTVGPFSTADGNIIDSPKQMSEIFVEVFARVFLSDVLPNPVPHQTSNEVMYSVNITADVEATLRSLEADGAMDPS